LNTNTTKFEKLGKILLQNINNKSMDEFEYIQSQIGYFFVDISVLKTAMTHKSYLAFKARDKSILEHNERLEFLGDAVLELIITDHLYKMYSKNEGFMTSLRSSLVNYKTLGEVGIGLGLDDRVLLSPGEKAELGKARLTIVADAVEALIGGIFVDGGYDNAKNFVTRFILSKLDEIINDKLFRDAKTELQEFTQKHLKLAPQYRVISTEGKDHDKTFFIEVYLGNVQYGSGVGKSKQDAETQSAIQALSKLNSEIIST
jgi:ribonuclease III